MRRWAAIEALMSLEQEFEEGVACDAKTVKERAGVSNCNFKLLEEFGWIEKIETTLLVEKGPGKGRRRVFYRLTGAGRHGYLRLLEVYGQDEIGKGKG